MYRNAGVLVVVVVVMLVVSLAGAEEYDKGAHSITRGIRKTVSNKPVDTLLFHESLKTNGHLLPYPRVRSHEVCYPPKKRHHAKFTITAFNIADAGKGGVAYMKKDGGGVGKHKVCFRFKSTRGRGYHFNIDIWGYYN